MTERDVLDKRSTGTCFSAKKSSVGRFTSSRSSRVGPKSLRTSLRERNGNKYFTEGKGTSKVPQNSPAGSIRVYKTYYVYLT